MRKLLFILIVLFPVCLHAQTIVFSGKVTNPKNEPLSGASIVIKPINRTLVTDVEGRFSVNLEPGKKYSLEISAISYAPKTIADIDVSKSADNNIDIVLEPSVKELEGIVIRSASTKRQENTVALLNFQRNNSALSSVMAADFIRQTPDKNTGEVLKRVSGASIQDNKYVIVRGLSDRYNQALLNDAPMPSSEPDKKAFSFDMIPATMIDNIIVNKTATPDLPGEFAGGLVQVNTKDIPSKSQLSVGFSLGYNTQSTFQDFTSNKRNSLDWLGFDDGSRSLPTGIPGISDYRAQTDEQKIETTRTFNDQVYSEVQKQALPITTLNLSYSGKKQFKNGGTFGTMLGLYHRHAEIIYDEVERGRYEQVRTPIFEGGEIQNRFSTNLGAIANFTYVKGKHKISFKNLFNQLYDDNYYTRLLNNTGRLQEVSLRSSFLNQRSLYSGQLEGDHALTTSGIRLKWNGSFSHNYKTQPDFRTAQYVRSFSDPNGDFELDDDDTRRFYSDLKDYNMGANGSLAIPFTMNDEKQTFKFGGGTLVRFRDFNARIFRYEPASSATDLSIPYNQAFLKSNINSNGLFLDEQTQNTDEYFGISALNNMFAMFDNKFGKLRVIWGLRAEFFEQYLESTDLSLKRITINTEKWDFLPSINATYAINAKNQVRVAASKTVARPEFREIAPFQFFDYEQIWGISGDPTLERTAIINADLRYEYYPKSGEVVSLGLIAKKFDKPIEIRMDPGSNGDRWLFNYANAEEATLYGVEFEIRKSLDFISERLSKLVFVGNATLLDSKVSLVTESNNNVKTEVDRPLFGQSPYLINAGFQY
ncbi:MAG TPA: carboxypeptidase regulatory-like domain-containing protein, partial [Chitinophagaceae bacterium]|nr:carboxypeptidase regulatory-like domain-containing protein [Chitinophagaceae bacterium]